MTEFDTQIPRAPTHTTRWPLAAVMLVDLVAAFIIALILAGIVAFGIMSINAAQQGLGLGQLQSLSTAEKLALIGAGGLTLTVLVQNLVFALVPIARVAWLRHEPLAEIGFTAARPLRLLAFGVGLGVLILMCNAAIGLLFSQFGIRQNQAAQYPLFAGDYTGQLLFALGAALLAPIGEEILFRGYCFNAIRLTFANRRWGVPLAYIASSLFFSFAHVLSATEGLVALLIPTFLMGLLLAWAMHRTGSLLPCIVAHALNNGVALLGLITCVNNPTMNGCPPL